MGADAGDRQPVPVKHGFDIGRVGVQADRPGEAKFIAQQPTGMVIGHIGILKAQPGNPF